MRQEGPCVTAASPSNPETIVSELSSTNFSVVLNVPALGNEFTCTKKNLGALHRLTTALLAKQSVSPFGVVAGEGWFGFLAVVDVVVNSELVALINDCLEVERDVLIGFSKRNP
jgi:hypothetical protein